MRRYDAAEIEPKWERVWEEEGLYQASDDPDDARPRFYALDMFPYPSGDLHMGHAEAFSGGDVIARFRWMQGYNVLHPSGGTRSACRRRTRRSSGIHPKQWTYENIEQQAASFKRMGFSFDWTRRLHSSDPEYYGWTQWLFLKLFEMGLAYRKNAPTNWCPKDQTVLANEQVINGACERCGTAVVRRDLTQWFFKITEYAQRLLDDVETLEEWPERVITRCSGTGSAAPRARRSVPRRRDGGRGRGVHDPSGHAVGRHVLRLRARAPAGPTLAEAGGTSDDARAMVDRLQATP